MANHHHHHGATTTAISITDHMLPSDTHNTYDVLFFGDTILTTVTHDPSVAAAWISDTESLHHHHRLIVGLDVEWRPSMVIDVFGRTRYSITQNPVATLQLCVGRRCLIYQLCHSPYVPKCLVDFLANPNYTFVGVGVKEDVEKLKKDYEFGFNTNTVELGDLAAAEYGRRELNKASLKDLVRVVLGKEMEKPKEVQTSEWDSRWLDLDQVRYACIDAFVSFEIGTILNASTASRINAPGYLVPQSLGTSSRGARSVTNATKPSVETSSTHDNNRKFGVIAGIATFAAAVGAGLYWLSSKERPQDDDQD